MNLRVSIPPLTRVLLAALVVISITSQVLRIKDPRSFDFLSLVPQYSIFYPWTFLTATFAERNPLTLLIAIAVILYGGRYLERAWGSMEFGKFILVISLVSNVLAVLFYVFLFAFTRDALDAWRNIRSSSALQSSFLVAFKQLVPEHTVHLLSPQLRIRVKHFPFLYLLLQTLSGILLGTRAAFTLSWCGFLTSWVYLRFIKQSGDELSNTGGAGATAGGGGGMRGDPSSLFAFACFFPDIAQPFISQITDRIYDLLVRLHIIKPFTSEEMSAGNEIANARTAGELPSLMNPTGGLGGRGGGGAGSAGRHREEAERRRRLALEALDQRLAAASNRGRPQSGSKAPTRAAPTQQRLEDAKEESEESEEVIAATAATAAVGKEEDGQT